MTTKQFLLTGYQDGRALLARHKLLALTLVVLCTVAGGSRLLQGDLLGVPTALNTDGSRNTEESLRSCTSAGTLFETVENLGDLRDIYKKQMSDIVGEREKILQTPSQWKCGAGAAGEPSIPKLQALAKQMPGWHYRVTVPLVLGSVDVPVSRPVTFASFGTIVAEFQREYECKLTELQDRIIAEIARNQDIEKPAQFCCITSEDGPGCREQSNDSACVSELSGDPQCGGECPVLLYMSDLASRSPILHQNILREREVSRVAVERTLNTIRSFEMNYAIARQFVCYERASLDLKNEMSLLADAVSCMPKIWDATTSIHDRK